MTFASLGVFLVILCSIRAVTVVDHHSEDEYDLEHEVLPADAMEEAKKLKIYPGPIPGCKVCSYSEMMYCFEDVVADHCCCDGGHGDEVFKFMPHKCLIGPEVCKVKAGDCAEYTRLRDCCCHTYHAKIWKYLATGSADKNYFSTSLIVAGVLAKVALT